MCHWGCVLSLYKYKVIERSSGRHIFNGCHSAVGSIHLWSSILFIANWCPLARRTKLWEPKSLSRKGTLTLCLQMTGEMLLDDLLITWDDFGMTAGWLQYDCLMTVIRFYDDFRKTAGWIWNYFAYYFLSCPNDRLKQQFNLVFYPNLNVLKNFQTKTLAKLRIQILKCEYTKI